MSDLYKSVILRMSPEKFREHKAAKGDLDWDTYFEVEKVRHQIIKGGVGVHDE